MTPSKPRCPDCDRAMKTLYERIGAKAIQIPTGDFKCPKCGKIITTKEKSG